MNLVFYYIKMTKLGLAVMDMEDQEVHLPIPD